ncbi:carboxylesterase family protein, partial [Aureobasidium melanogenum]
MIWITTKGSNVFLNPSQSKTLVSESVHVDADSNDGHACFHRLLNDERLVVTMVCTATHDKTSSVDPDKHRKALTRTCWLDDIQSQTVFAHIVALTPGVSAISDTLWAVLSSIPGSRPGSVERLRDTETCRCHRRMHNSLSAYAALRSIKPLARALILIIGLIFIAVSPQHGYHTKHSPALGLVLWYS